MTIRKARQQDILPIAEIYEAIHTEEEKGTLTIGWQRNVYPTMQTAQAALDRGDLYVAEDEGIVGAAIINQIQAEGYDRGAWRYEAADREILVLHTLVIAPSQNGKGYGGAFVDYYEEHARKMGCRYLRLDTNERNLRARAFYKNRGYREAGIVRTMFNGLQDVNLVLLEKKL